MSVLQNVHWTNQKQPWRWIAFGLPAPNVNGEECTKVKPYTFNFMLCDDLHNFRIKQARPDAKI